SGALPAAAPPGTEGSPDAEVPAETAVLGQEAAAVSPAPAQHVDGAWSLQGPRFMARIPTSPRYLFVAIAIPAAVIVFLVLCGAVLFKNGPAVPGGSILFTHFITDAWVDTFTLPVVALVALLAVMGVRRFWGGLQASLPPGVARRPLGEALRGTAREVLSHDEFETWTTSDVRRVSHLAMFYGFLGLMMATTGAFIYTEIFPLFGIRWHRNRLSLPIWDPVKIVGNLGGIALLFGLVQTLSLWRRRSGTDRPSTYSDWFFPGLLGLTAVTGFATELLRYANLRLAYPVYVVHLVFIFALFVHFPFSKFAHAVYYPAGFTFARLIGRRKPTAAITATPCALESDAAPV